MPAPLRTRDDHSSGPPLAGRFSRPTRTPRAGNGPAPQYPQGDIRSAESLFGLAPGGACHAVRVATSAVGSYPTLSPFPPPRRRRFAFCGAIPRVTPGGRYPPPCFRGARTFLDPLARTAIARPSDPGRVVREGGCGVNGVRGSTSLATARTLPRSKLLGVSVFKFLARLFEKSPADRLAIATATEAIWPR